MIREAALSLLHNGFSVLPCNHHDKFHVGDNPKKPTVFSWAPYQKKTMNLTEAKMHFVDGVSIGVICGKVSGNLECLDFDQPDLYKPFMETLTSINQELAARLVKRQTPSGGYHLIYRSEAPISGSQKLAVTEDGKGTLIETRGNGSYFLTAPSPGYKVIERSLLDVPTLSANEVDLLHTIAKSFTEKVEPIRTPRDQQVSFDGTRPGDDFNQRCDFRQLLESNGWTTTERTGPGGEHWTRPGKTHGTSATLKDGCLYVFSSNAVLPPGPNDSFSVYTHLNHGGDYTAAARDLGKQGYGKKDFAVFAVPKGGTSEKKTESVNPIPLPEGLPKVEAFDYRLLPERLAPWVQDISERVQCPPDYVAVTVMVALGSIIGRKVGIRPQAQTDWTVTPNQWALLIGRPGVLKSPAMEAALAPVKWLAAKAQERYEGDLVIYAEQEAINKLRVQAKEKKTRELLAKDPNADVATQLASKQPEAPVLRRYYANDTSAASLGELHRENQNGLLVYRDELVSLLRTLDREDNSEARGFYLTGWNGDSPYTFDRITRGMNLHIPAVCISMLGSTQPGRISNFIKAAVNGGTGDDGLLQRFGITIWPDTGNAWKDVDRWPNNEAKQQAFKAFNYLDNLNPADIGALQDKDYDGLPDGIPYLRFDDDGLDMFREWRTDLETRLRSGDLHPALESHLAKYRKLVPGLALIIHLADGYTGSVGNDAVLKALAWSEYLESHARRLYASLTVAEVSAAQAIIAKIKSGALTSPFKSWQVWRPGWAGLSESQIVSEALQLLVDYHWLFLNRIDTRGRPSEEYTINPEVLK